MSVTFTQVRNTIDLSEKIKIGSGEKVVKTDKIGRSKKIEFTITSKAGKFFAYFDGEKYAGSYKKQADVEKIAKDYLKLVGEEVEVVTEREDTASAVAKAMKKMGVKYDRKKEDDIISKIPKVLDSMKLSSGAKRMLLRDKDFISDVLDDLGEELRENRAKRDAMRAMGMRRGKDSADVDNDATDDDMKAADKNIMVQLRKVITLRGMKPVTFDNGKKAKINPKDAEKMLSIYQGLKPASKLQLQKVLSKSPQDFAKAVKQLKENEFFDEDITEAVKYTYVAVDAKGKIIGFAGGAKAAADAKDMARRNKGVVHKLKKPMATKVGDMEINRPFNPVLKAEVEIDEGMKMDDPKLIKIFDKLKKGSKIKIKHDSTLERGKDFISYTVTAKNIVGKGKRFEQEKITLKNDDNPTGMKKYLYNRDGKVTMAAGDMAVSIADIREEVELDESMMSRIHQMVSDGASAKEIADEISKLRPKNKVDVKTIQKLIKGMKGDMSESVEKNITFKSFVKQL